MQNPGIWKRVVSCAPMNQRCAEIHEGRGRPSCVCRPPAAHGRRAGNAEYSVQFTHSLTATATAPD